MFHTSSRLSVGAVDGALNSDNTQQFDLFMRGVRVDAAGFWVLLQVAIFIEVLYEFDRFPLKWFFIIFLGTLLRDEA